MSPMKKTIDLNLDAGESLDGLNGGTEEQLFALVSSVNIACGGHAGDLHTMRRAVQLAMKNDLAIGAHPSYPDPENFGRAVVEMDSEDLTYSLTEQIRALEEVCFESGVSIRHVKPHGALYHQLSEDRKVARAFFEALRRVGGNLAVTAMAGSDFHLWAKEAGFKTLGEGFVDRRYEDETHLRSRQEPGALIEDGREAGEQALTLLPRVDTLCIHADTPLALRIARSVCATLTQAGVTIDHPFR
jgi:5-oxoprolinase (ATP-hydrolysing) subunit A